jgi:eukaryotic-like serine/threonine-protein kinase
MFHGGDMAMTGAQVLGGRYVLGPALGSGGMATVFRARDEVLGRDVAVKILGQPFANDAAFLARFEREARHVAALSDPHIVTVFDSGVDGTSPFIVMELVPGRSLRQVLDETGALPVTEAVAIASDICQGLEAVHAAGLIHRDITPANILLSGGSAKVLDFGIARADGSAAGTRTEGVLGTAAYLSPEQASGRPVGPRSDLYSLGCVFFEMLTGEPPFTADSAVAVAYRQVHDHPGRPSARKPGLPPRLDWITAQLLMKAPDARPASAAAVRAALLAVEHRDQTAVLLPVPDDADADRPAKPGRWRPRRSEIALTAALAATATALAIVLLVRPGAAAAGSPPGRPASSSSHQAHRASPGHPGTSAPASQDRRGPLSPTAAATAAFVGNLKEGVSDSDVSQQAGQNLFSQLEQLLFYPPAGNAQQVDQQYSQLVQVYDQYLGQGQITGWAAAALRHDLTELGSALGVP